MNPPPLLKFPRTPHLEGSRLQPGDQDLSRVPLATIANRQVVVEEKVDGSNCGVSFDGDGRLWLQSRGHYLVGGPRERHFEQLKAWTGVHQSALWEILGDRYVMYGEWMAAKHTVFYDQLPHLFLEFDIYDREAGVFLDAGSRQELLKGSPVVSIPALHNGQLDSKFLATLQRKPSAYKSKNWIASLAAVATAQNQNLELVRAQTDNSDLAEGLYFKIEEDGRAVERYKWVRPDFTNTICDPTGAPSSHWLDRPHLPNLLAEGVDIYATESTVQLPGPLTEKDLGEWR